MRWFVDLTRSSATATTSFTSTGRANGRSDPPRHPRRRLTIGGADIITDLERRVGLRGSDLALEALVDTAASVTWTRDPFDRLIVADALVAGAPLITKDRSIHDHTTIARW